MQMHLHSTELIVNEVALAKGEHFDGPDFQRLDCLYTCLHAAQNWFDIFLKIPVADYVGVSISEFTQLAHCMIALYRLSTFEWPGWDCGLARDIVNLSAILGKLAANFEQVKAAVGRNEGDSMPWDVFTVTAGRLGQIKTWWDTKLSAEAIEPSLATMNENIGEASMTMLDDAWLQDYLGTGPYRFDSFGQ